MATDSAASQKTTTTAGSSSDNKLDVLYIGTIVGGVCGVVVLSALVLYAGRRLALSMTRRRRKLGVVKRKAGAGASPGRATDLPSHTTPDGGIVLSSSNTPLSRSVRATPVRSSSRSASQPVDSEAPPGGGGISPGGSPERGAGLESTPPAALPVSLISRFFPFSTPRHRTPASARSARETLGYMDTPTRYSSGSGSARNAGGAAQSAPTSAMPTPYSGGASTSPLPPQLPLPPTFISPPPPAHSMVYAPTSASAGSPHTGTTGTGGTWSTRTAVTSAGGASGSRGSSITPGSYGYVYQGNAAQTVTPPSTTMKKPPQPGSPAASPATLMDTITRVAAYWSPTKTPPSVKYDRNTRE